MAKEHDSRWKTPLLWNTKLFLTRVFCSPWNWQTCWFSASSPTTLCNSGLHCNCAAAKPTTITHRIFTTTGASLKQSVTIKNAVRLGAHFLTEGPVFSFVATLFLSIRNDNVLYRYRLRRRSLRRNFHASKGYKTYDERSPVLSCHSRAQSNKTRKWSFPLRLPMTTTSVCLHRSHTKKKLRSAFLRRLSPMRLRTFVVSWCSISSISLRRILSTMPPHTKTIVNLLPLTMYRGLQPHLQRLFSKSRTALCHFDWRLTHFEAHTFLHWLIHCATEDVAKLFLSSHIDLNGVNFYAACFPLCSFPPVFWFNSLVNVVWQRWACIWFSPFAVILSMVWYLWGLPVLRLRNVLPNSLCEEPCWPDVLWFLNTVHVWVLPRLDSHIHQQLSFSDVIFMHRVANRSLWSLRAVLVVWPSLICREPWWKGCFQWHLSSPSLVGLWTSTGFEHLEFQEWGFRCWEHKKLYKIKILDFEESLTMMFVCRRLLSAVRTVVFRQ